MSCRFRDSPIRYSELPKGMPSLPRSHLLKPATAVDAQGQPEERQGGKKKRL